MGRLERVQQCGEPPHLDDDEVVVGE